MFEKIVKDICLGDHTITIKKDHKGQMIAQIIGARISRNEGQRS